ncbi:MAG: type IV toxin-antitoxin system AbiEi family antitoxin domain-containing protein [Betaproteobacteria bacterium]|nr:MAG: type IV toxin-antitoxin system AbiEi family antitoxin domain-containing protein [Betaproteobacteria bacterium]
MPAATDRDRTLKLAGRRQGVTARELVQAGIHRQVLSRLVAGGQLERIARGLYRLPEHAVTEHHGLAIAAAAVPQGVVCCVAVPARFALDVPLLAAGAQPGWKTKSPPCGLLVVARSA